MVYCLLTSCPYIIQFHSANFYIPSSSKVAFKSCTRLSCCFDCCFCRLRCGLGAGGLRLPVFRFCSVARSADRSAEVRSSYDVIPKDRRQINCARQEGESLDWEERDRGVRSRSSGCVRRAAAAEANRQRKPVGEFRTLHMALLAAYCCIVEWDTRLTMSGFL